MTPLSKAVRWESSTKHIHLIRMFMYALYVTSTEMIGRY